VTPKISEGLLDALSDYVNSRMGLHFPPVRRSDLERGLVQAAPDLGFDDADPAQDGSWCRR